VVGERLARSLMPTSTLLVSNLPTLLFSQTVDLHPLLLPFGQIKMLNILGSPMDSGIADKMSVIVEYATFYNAQDARETLRGQCYAGCTLNAEYVRTTSHAEFGPGAAYTNGFDKYSENSVSNLNPFAPPFFLEAPQLGSFVEHFAPFHGSPKVKNHHNLYADPQYLSPYALPHPFSYMNGHLPTSRVASRSSSATSR
jgi:hypothetical protein